jgi:hypothetical protein
MYTPERCNKCSYRYHKFMCRKYDSEIFNVEICGKHGKVTMPLENGELNFDLNRKDIAFNNKLIFGFEMNNMSDAKDEADNTWFDKLMLSGEGITFIK